MRASAVLLDKTKQFIVLIKRVKSGRTYFVLPGGTVKAGETFQEAVIREINEELNLDCSSQMIRASRIYEDG